MLQWLQQGGPRNPGLTGFAPAVNAGWSPEAALPRGGVHMCAHRREGDLKVMRQQGFGLWRVAAPGSQALVHCFVCSLCQATLWTKLCLCVPVCRTSAHTRVPSACLQPYAYLTLHAVNAALTSAPSLCVCGQSWGAQVLCNNSSARSKPQTSNWRKWLLVKQWSGMQTF